MWDAQDSESFLQFLQTIQHERQVIVMEHWTEIRTCEYHEDERMPCEECSNANEDYLADVFKAIQETSAFNSACQISDTKI
jgi:predicted ATPase